MTIRGVGGWVNGNPDGRAPGGRAPGVTAGYTVAVWAGHADGRPTQGLPALRAAAPLLRAALLALAVVILRA